MRKPSTNTVANYTITVPNTSVVIEALTGNTMYRFDVIAISMFNGIRLNSNVTSTSFATPTGSELYIRLTR